MNVDCKYFVKVVKIVIGIFCLIGSEVIAKKQTRNDFTGRRQYIVNSISDITNDFIQGSVIFGGAAALTEDNDNLFWDNINKRLGLGTDTPLAQLHTTQGRVVGTTRITGDITLDETHHKVLCDTDGGAIIATLPAGVDGTNYIIYNTGSSSNAVTITPNGSELLYGMNSNYTILDGGAEVATFETTEGWR